MIRGSPAVIRFAAVRRTAAKPGNERPAAGCQERMIHATRSVAYGCSRQGLTRFATFLWVGPLPAPHRGLSGVSVPLRTPVCSLLDGLRLFVNRHLLDDHRLLGVGPRDVLGVGR